MQFAFFSRFDCTIQTLSLAGTSTNREEVFQCDLQSSQLISVFVFFRGVLPYTAILGRTTETWKQNLHIKTLKGLGLLEKKSRSANKLQDSTAK